MAVGVAKEFVARLAVQPHADLVAHRAGGDEQRGFLAEHAGDALFEAADGGVFAEHVVAHFGGGHGGAHAGRGAGDGIAAEVDHGRADGWRLEAGGCTLVELTGYQIELTG